MNLSAKAPEAASTSEGEKRDAYAALRFRDFRLFLSGHLLSTLCIQMQSLAVSWQLYERTNSKLALGMVGLVQIVPILGLALPAGQAADRFDRRKTLMSATTLAVIAAFGLVAVGKWASANVPLIYASLFLSGLRAPFKARRGQR